MTTVINGNYPTTEENNRMFAKGYKFQVVGDWTLLASTDPWSGMPNVDGRIHYFTDREEAEEYAAKQIWPFNPNMHGEVEEVTYRKTYEEEEAEIAEKKAKKAEAKAAKEAAKAAEKGMTVEAYREYRKIEATKKRYEKRLIEIEAEIAKLHAEMEEKKNFILTH